MKRFLVVPFLLAAVKAPPTWREDKTAGTQLAAKTEADLKARGASAAATAQVFVAPDDSVLYVTLVARKVPSERDATAREIVDGFLGAPRRAQLTSTKVSIAGSGSKLDTGAKQIEATLQWQDDDAGSLTHARLLVTGDAEHLISITGECFLRPTTPAEIRDACIAALATLDTEVPADKRAALALAPEGTEPERPVAPGPSMSDVPHTPVGPIAVQGAPPKRTVDRRPVYVGAGLVVLAGLFWWNRRRRERLEAESSKKDSDE